MDEAKTNHDKFLKRLIKDRDFRQRILIFVLLCWSFIVLGWLMAQLGPALLDLQELTNITLEEASLFVTATFIGLLIGSIINGLLFDRMNKFVILVIGLVQCGSTAAIIPFMFVYEVMLFLHFVRGLGAGILISGVNALLMIVFEGDKSARVYMQILHFTYAVGGILSPLATAPFLLKKKTNNSSETTEFLSNTTSHVMLTSEYAHVENTSLDYKGMRESELYIPYLTSTGLCATSAILFVLLVLSNQSSIIDTKTSSKEAEISRDNLPTSFKIVVLVFLSVFIAVCCGMEDAFFSFLATFTVKFFHWEKTHSSYVSSVYWGAYAFGRFTAIFIAPHLKPSSFLKIYINGLLIACVGMLLSAIFNFDSGVWICSPLVGFSISTLFPSILLLTGEDLLPVTGRVASLLMFAASGGAMIGPVITGFLMDNLSAISFPYITLVDCVVLFVMTWTAPLLCNRKRKYENKEPRKIEISTLSTRL